jgi:hypothetical protein
MWITPCTDKNFCFNQGSCTEGKVFLVEKAVTNCPNNTNINYSYRIDLYNDGSTDIVSPDDTVNMNFPAGTHKITWKANDNCADVANCSYLFTIKDCLPPGVICIGNLTQNVIPGCVVTFDVASLAVNFQDNCTPDEDLVFGLKKAGDGTGFPTQTSVTFDGCDFGPHQLEIWVKDENNLVGKCFSTVEIQDNDDICGCASVIALGGCVRSPDSTKLEKYTLRADLDGAPAPVFIQKNIPDSCFSESFPPLISGQQYNITVRARRTDNALEGVSTFDLLQTSKHILNVQPFQNAYQRLAADVNASNSVTTFDVVETRKLILGIYDTFPKVQSWRFVRPVADPTNLLSAVKDTYRITITNLTADVAFNGLDFVGIKMGDTNLSATFTGNDTDDRAPLLLEAGDRALQAGESLSVPVRISEAILLDGWQMAIAVDPALARLEGADGLPDDDFLLAANELRALWFDPAGKYFARGDILFRVKIRALQAGRLSEMLRLSSARIRPEAYVLHDDGTEQRQGLMLGFGAQKTDAAAFFPPQPNPFGTETRLGILLRTAGHIDLDVYDVSGKKILGRRLEAATGYHTLPIQASELPGAGMYFYRVMAGGEVFSGKLLRR